MIIKILRKKERCPIMSRLLFLGLLIGLSIITNCPLFAAASNSTDRSRYYGSKTIHPSKHDAVGKEVEPKTPKVSPEVPRKIADASEKFSISGIGIPRSKSEPESLGGMLLPDEVFVGLLSMSSVHSMSPSRFSPLARVASLTNFEEKIKGQVLDKEQQHLAEVVRGSLQKSKSDMKLIDGSPIATSSVPVVQVATSLIQE
jgi:hypothetical protein